MLILPIKKKWFDMILSGEKKEEYRDITPYWQKRILNARIMWKLCGHGQMQIYIRNGYGKKAPTAKVTLSNISMGYGRTEWGADLDKRQFIFHISDAELCREYFDL